jgi:hypothetical protein
VTPVATHRPALAEPRIGSHPLRVWNAVRKVGSAGALLCRAVQAIGERLLEVCP